MRIAVVSDIHGNLPALQAVVADCARRGGADQFVNLGDSLSGPLLPLETAQYLMAQKDWVHLAGNHERQILNLHARSSAVDVFAHTRLSRTELDWIAGLPHVHQLNADVLLCHGTPTSDVTCLLENADQAASAADIAARLGGVEASLVLCGHTHVPRSVLSGATRIVNPGSVGHPAYSDDHPYPHAIQSGSPDARYAIVEQHQGAWVATLITVPYGYQAMAALARQQQRLDWERALLTGYTL